jgi:hypothetical protein
MYLYNVKIYYELMKINYQIYLTIIVLIIFVYLIFIFFIYNIKIIIKL